MNQPKPIKIEEKREDVIEKGAVAQKMEQESVRPVQSAEHEKVGRNDPCWCGSGKKYKKCHGK